MRCASLAALLLPLLAACEGLAPVPPSGSASATVYRCTDGREVAASYSGETAKLTLDGRTVTLHLAISADGARYVGHGLQWWTKGMTDAMLAPLAPGESIAAALGVACKAG